MKREEKKLVVLEKKNLSGLLGEVKGAEGGDRGKWREGRTS